MKRAIQWGKPITDKVGNVTRTSKCGKYRIVTRTIASGRNGHWNARVFEPVRVSDGARLCGRDAPDSLSLALDLVESDNDPDWEPN